MNATSCSFRNLLFLVLSCQMCVITKLLQFYTELKWFFFPKIRINDEGKEIAVGKNNLLLRGCIIRNTDWVEGMVVYAGA